ncbi:SM-20-related protein [Oceanimonas baumannii]|uniref:SM-20-related protein n=1 Tax=Oceanimonas baumannii TaxID=129578 RepID=A0ABY2EY24_9GAMM|nr:SM-20-related protein [Oceanimonas baumannii]
MCGVFSLFLSHSFGSSRNLIPADRKNFSLFPALLTVYISIPQEGLLLTSAAHTNLVHDDIIGAIAGPGIGIFPDFLNTAQIAALRHDFVSLPDWQITPAGIGREQANHNNERIRTDKTRWLDGSTAPQQAYMTQMADLQQQLNRHLFMGLKDYECHYARYDQGDFYKKHLDAFRGRSNRRLTTVLYLNDHWQPEHGGELLVYGDKSKTPVQRIMPAGGTLVCFLSERFPHEVLPANRARLSIAGWFRVDDPITPALRL